MLATMTELGSRTSNALGLFAFDPVTREGVVDRVPIDVVGIAEITIATGIWTSGQHGNALSVLGMALYAIPICGLCVIGVTCGLCVICGYSPLAGAGTAATNWSTILSAVMPSASA